jgi:hypothetical protein
MICPKAMTAISQQAMRKTRVDDTARAMTVCADDACLGSEVKSPAPI